MRKSFIAILCGVLCVSGTLFAADDESAPPPTLVLPQVTLDIQDLSTENVQAMLPPAQASATPQVALTLPGAPVFSPVEPARQLAVEGSDPLGGAEVAQRPLATQATLGLGTQNRVLGRLNVTTVGGSTHSNLSFAHESADGIDGKAAGSGFDTRDDTITGSLSGKLGPMDGSFQGGYSEKSLGLQDQSPYVSRLGRALDGTGSLTAPIFDWLSIDGSASGAYDSLTLAAVPNSSPGQWNEYKGSGHAGATARTGILTAGISGDFGYRVATMLGGAEEQVQRLRAGASVGLNFPGSLLVEGSAAWFLNSEGLSLLPFSLHATGTVVRFVTFDASFGYRVIPYDEEDIYNLSPYIVPLSLVDDRGWFGDAAVQLTLFEGLSVKVGASYMNSSDMPTTASTTDPTGLFLVFQQAAVRVTGDTSVRWTIVPGMTLDARWQREFMDRPSFVPQDTITVEAIAMEATGAYGGQAAATMLTGSTFTVLPELDVGGFVRLSEAAQLRLDLYDILSPLLGGSRYGPSLSPYVEPGFRAVASVRLSF